MQPEQKRFSDFCAELTPLDGDKERIESVLNQEIRVIGYQIKRSKFGEKGPGKCLTVQFERDGARKVLFTGSQVLIEQFEKYGSEIPFLATIKKIDRYYTLS